MNVLIADADSVSLRKLEESLVNMDYTVIACKEGLEAWEAIQSENAPKLLILDWMMPGMNGVEICRKVRKLDKGPYTYILLLTSKDGKDDIVEGMEAGADDYITKPFYPHELEVRLRAGRRIIELNDKLQIQATHDALTEIPNRRAILSTLALEVERSKRVKKHLSIAILDIDNFKQINDSYGLQVGDQVLYEVAKTLRSKLRVYDSIGRYGGEEFLVILPDCDRNSVRSPAERLRTCISGTPIVTTETTVTVTISIGVSFSKKGDEANMTSLIKAADEALCRAKEKGQNLIEVASVG